MKKHLKKGVMLAASAALVTSAVAPTWTAQANTKTFSDVTDANDHKDNIYALVSRGIINGYPNGTFQPWKTLSRSDVVKMLGRFLMENGQPVPADYKTNMRYRDLTVNSSEELLRYAAVVKEAGVFNGDPNGNLNPFGNMTRQNISLVLVRTLAFVMDMTEQEVIAFTEMKNPSITLADLQQANAESRPYIKALKYFGVTNVDNYRPRESTNRAQYASFLNRMFQQVLENNGVLQQLELYKDGLRVTDVVIKPDGTEATGNGVTPGRTIIIYDVTGKEIGRGVVAADGTYKIIFTSPVKGGDRIKIVIDIDGNPATTNDQTVVEVTVPNNVGTTSPPATEAEKKALKDAHDSIQYVAVSTDGREVPRNAKWTTAAEKTALELAAANAKTVLEKASPTQKEVNDMLAALNAAKATYISVQKDGLLTADKAGLQTLLNSIQYVAVSVDGSDVGSLDKWTTATEKKALEDVVAAANAVMADPNASSVAIQNTQTALLAAKVAYEAAQKFGQRAADKTSLQRAIQEAQAAYVTVSVDGKDVHPSMYWTTQAEKTALENAVVTANATLLNTNATNAQVANAQAVLLEALNRYNAAKKPGQQSLTLAPTISTLKLKTEAPGNPAQYAGITAGTSISFAAIGLNLIDEDVIDVELIGTDGLVNAPKFTVPQGNTLDFTATLTNSSVLALGQLNLLVLKGVESTKTASGEYTQYENVASDSAVFLSLLGIPLQSQYNFAFYGLDGGTYILAAAPSGGLGVNALGGMALRVNSVDYVDRQDSINADLVATPTTGAVTMPSETVSLTSVRPVTNNAANQQAITQSAAGTATGMYGRLTVNSNGTYSYRSDGKVASVGKVDVFEVTASNGAKGMIYIRTDLEGAQPLNWSATDLSANAPIVTARIHQRALTLTPPSTYSEETVVAQGILNTTNDATYYSPQPSAQNILEGAQNNFIKGTDSYLTFEPYSTLLLGNPREFTYRVYKIVDLNDKSKDQLVFEQVMRFNVNYGAISLTGLDRGYYRVEAKESESSLLTYGVSRFKTFNLSWTTTNIANERFVTTNYAESVANNMGYMIDGSDLYVEGVKINNVTNNTATGTDIRGAYGTLKVFANGTYSYASDANVDVIGKQDVFNYTIVGPNGDESSATITINLQGNATFTNPILNDNDVRDSGTRIYKYEGKVIRPNAATAAADRLIYSVVPSASYATTTIDYTVRG